MKFFLSFFVLNCLFFNLFSTKFPKVYNFSIHALKRMKERGITREEVEDGFINCIRLTIDFQIEKHISRRNSLHLLNVIAVKNGDCKYLYTIKTVYVTPFKTMSRTSKELFFKYKLIGADLQGLKLNGLRLEKRDYSFLNFKNSELKNSSLINSNLNLSNFEKARLRNFNFLGTDLSESIFIDADLADVNFEGADLTGVDFTGATLENVNFNAAKLRGAKFSNTTFKEVNFKGADLLFADIDLKD